MRNLTATHRLSKTREYEAWRQMRSRCSNPKHQGFANYGGRGITVAPEWESFERFYADMGPRPGPEYSLDRIDNDGPYAPGNCRWATKVVQGNNRRTCTLLAHHGRTLTLVEWAREVGISSATILARFRKGWSVEKALTTPLDLFYSNKRKSST
jgi:hypothetical protein